MFSSKFPNSFFLKGFPIFFYCLCLFVFINLVAYVFYTRQYPQWDEHHYLSMAVKFYDILRHPTLDSYKIILSVSGSRQPLIGLIYAFPLFFVGTQFTYKSALLLNGVFYVFSILGVYGIARQFLSKLGSLTASVFFAFYGHNLFYIHFTYSETAVTTCIVFSFYFLLKNESFLNRKFTILSALFLEAAILIRWIAPIFLVGSFVFVSFPLLRKRVRGIGDRGAIINWVLFLLVAFGIPLVTYYLPNFKEFYDYVRRNQTYGPEWVALYRDSDLANTFSTRSLMYYLNILSQNTVFIFSFFVVGLLVALRKFKKYIALLVTFIIPYCFFTFIVIWKEDRFIVPIYPVVAILSALPLDYIKSTTIKMLYFWSVVVVSLLVFFGALWGVGPMGKRGLTDLVLPAFIHHPRRIYLTPLVWPPTREYLNADQIVKVIEEDRGKSSVQVVSLFSFEPIDNALYSILTYEKRNSFIYESYNPQNDKSFGKIEVADYYLTKEETLASAVSRLNLVSNSRSPVSGESMGILIGTVSIPMDGSSVFIYRSQMKHETI